MFADEVINTLLDNPKITDVVELSFTSYHKVDYECLISCSFTIAHQKIHVYIGVPSNWDLALFDVYIVGFMDFPYIPHIDFRSGKLCLFELEGVLIDTDFSGLLVCCISRAFQMLSDGLLHKNKQEFIREFELYWKNLPGIGLIKCDIACRIECQSIKFIQQTDNNAQGVGSGSYKKNNDIGLYFAASNPDGFNAWGVRGSQHNGIALYFHAYSEIYPPDCRQALEVEFINNLLSFVPVNKYPNDCLKIICKSDRVRLFLFQIEQPDGTMTGIGIVLKNASISNVNGRFQIIYDNTLKITPLSLQRVDKAFLMNRTKSESISSKMKCLLIGCGSIGGYLANELISAGFDDITFVDDDSLKEENIYRHILGSDYIDINKANALERYFKKRIPHLITHAKGVDIRQLIEDSVIDFDDYDLILSATGNHNVNRWINKEVHFRDIDVPVFYVWNEPLDIGCHAAVISASYDGCYECFFTHSIYTLIDSTAYTAPGETAVTTPAGCGGSYVPYSASVSIRSASLCMDLITRYLDGRCKSNVLVSMKGDGYYFTNAGLSVTDVYRNQHDKIYMKEIRDFNNGECEVCK
ncbi:MAG: ThiF family adenylyltransferase [Candidatus Limiplasma sp.]|nr:ThiF family adenylyltransferase [Candidatus Limiplasma sp.]